MKNWLARAWHGAWLDAPRARAWLYVWLALVPLGVTLILRGFAGYAAIHGGKAPATDFMPFWSAARLALQHGPSAAYDNSLRIALQRETAGYDGEGFFGYWYPPPFLLLTLPLGILSYPAAALLFAALSFAVIFAAAYGATGSRLMGWAAAAAPGVLITVIIGQNGAFTAACFLTAAIWLDRRPWVGGAMLGLLICKPHLALLAPFALLASGRWRALLGCAAAALSLGATTLIWGGLEAWRAVLRHAGEPMAILAAADEWPKIQSLYAAARLLGCGMNTAYALQLCGAGIVVIALLYRLRQRPDGLASMALLSIAGLLTTPYMYDYDLPLTLIGLIFALRQGAAKSFAPGEKLFLLAIYSFPLAARYLSITYGVPLTPPALFGLYWHLWRLAGDTLPKPRGLPAVRQTV
jgi:hypothetical protein